MLSALRKLGVKISKPTLHAHLEHLIKEKLIERKEEGFQNVSYGVTEKVKSAFNVSKEDVKEMFEVFEHEEKIPKHLKSLKMTAKEFYARLSGDEIDRVSNIDLLNILRLNLLELKTFIDYDLKLGTFESDKDFWNFVGNPLYRMSEKSVVENCRASDKYRKKFFEKIEFLINRLKTDKNFLN